MKWVVSSVGGVALVLGCHVTFAGAFARRWRWGSLSLSCSEGWVLADA